MANVLADCLASWDYDELDPFEFYRSIFPEGELDVYGAKTKGKYAGIALEISKSKETGFTDVKRFSVLDDLEAVRALFSSENFCVLAPISYAGKTRKSVNARFMYALVVELDNLVVKGDQQTGLIYLMGQWSKKVDWLPRPTFLVCSGNGLHLYYVFEFPVPLFPNIVKELAEYKRELTRKIWNRHVTTTFTKDVIQQESIFQAFRMVGTRTKSGDTVRAFHIGNLVTLEYLNEYVDDEYKVTVVYKSDCPKAEAKRLYPDWYERRVVRGEPKGSWVCNRAVYDWWKKRIYKEAAVGHRYYCLMCLAIYAIKSDIEYKELERDCFDLMKVFEEKTISSDNHFTEKDVIDALQCFWDKGLVTYPINSIANRSGIEIQKNKRNGLSRPEHLEVARLYRDIRQRRMGTRWTDNNGRPDKKEVVFKWRQQYPDGRKIECEKDTGLSRHTVLKWWAWKPDPEEV